MLLCNFFCLVPFLQLIVQLFARAVALDDAINSRPFFARTARPKCPPFRQHTFLCPWNFFQASERLYLYGRRVGRRSSTRLARICGRAFRGLVRSRESLAPSFSARSCTGRPTKAVWHLDLLSHLSETGSTRPRQNRPPGPPPPPPAPLFRPGGLEKYSLKTDPSFSRPLPIPHRHMLMLGALQKPLMVKLLMVPLETASAPPAAAPQRLPGREFWLNFVPSLKSGTA